MNKLNGYVTELLHKIREDISAIKRHIFTEQPKLESAEDADTAIHYDISVIHKDGQSNEENRNTVRATLHLPPTIKVDAKTQEHPKSWAEDRASRLQAIAIAVGGLVLIVYACQLNQMVESNEISRDALESVQRAFMVFKEIKQTRIKDAAGNVSWDFSPMYENMGTTPALHAVNSFVYGAGKGQFPEDEFLKGGGAAYLNPDTIGPKALRQGPKVLIDESHVFGIFLGDKFENFGQIKPSDEIYFWGWMTYRDVFRKTKTHVTEFCRHMVAPQLYSSEPPQIMFNFETCPQQHNCTDEQCPDYDRVVEFAEGRKK